MDKPNKINESLTNRLAYEIHKLEAPTIMSYYLECLRRGTRFYVCDNKQISGYCKWEDDSSSNNGIAIPFIVLPSLLFIREKSIHVKQWLISHEIAHAMDYCKHNHGPEFMEWLKKICPADAIGHEVSYKPANALRAGIICADF